ncbi:cytochrome P450 [Mucor ambiguus]|uniref:Cytochrome P450 n=1 Tax=Mucor ambiguus TaxID=91626 RepID=A0A0C9MH79_9FUNG|nr:cytochrome P450 [Mucor ambiguus]
MMSDTAIQKYRQVLQRLLPFFQNRKNRYACIGAAIVCLLSRHIYRSIVLPPEHLRAFPQVSTFQILNSFRNFESVPSRIKRLINPITDAGYSFYMARSPLAWNLFVADPKAAKIVLMKTDNFPKTHQFFSNSGNDTPLAMLLGKENVAVSNGDVWRKQRKIMNPAFHRSRPIKTFGSVMPFLFSVIDENPDKVMISKQIKGFTLDALGLSVFGFDFQSLRGDPQNWADTYHTVMSNIFNPLSSLLIRFSFIWRLVSTKFVQIEKATDRLLSMMENLADEKRRQILNGEMEKLADQEKDLLTMMIEADIEEGTKTTTTQLRQNIAFFLFAGHDTTANAISLCIYNLAKNPDVQQKLREEVSGILGNDPTVVPTLDDLKKMAYLDLVIKENLRRSGPVDRIVSRDATDDFIINGTHIPKGTQLNIDIGSLHFNPKLWHSPEKFIPERFAPGGEHDSHEGFAYLPFGHGARQCIGMNFSLIEQKVVIAMLGKLDVFDDLYLYLPSVVLSKIVKKYFIEVPKDSIHYDEIQFDMPMTISPESLELKFTKL